MTIQDVAAMVRTVGIPTAYYAFPEGTEMATPFLCFMFTSSGDMYADDSNYQDIRTLVVELYTANKDFELENSVREVLTANNLTFTMASDYISSERMFITTYTMEVVIQDGE